MKALSAAGLLVLVFALAFKPIIFPALLSTRCSPLDLDIGTVPLLSTEELRRHVHGKDALVIGGTRGVGYGTSLALARAGAFVTVVGRSAKSGQLAVDKIHSSLERESNTSSGRGRVEFLPGDIGSVRTAKKLVETLAGNGRRYDFLVVSAASFPDWQGKLQQEDGLDSCFSVAVVGRFVVFRNMHRFLQMDGDPRVLSVMAAGQKPFSKFDRDLATGFRNVTSLFESIGFWAMGHDIMQFALQQYDANARLTTRVITHPGFVKTDLHRGQGLIFDIIETAMIALNGISEEDCGMNQASILVAERLRNRSVSSVDFNMKARIVSKELQTEVDEHVSWLWSFLNKIVDGDDSTDQ